MYLGEKRAHNWNDPDVDPEDDAVNTIAEFVTETILTPTSANGDGLLSALGAQLWATMRACGSERMRGDDTVDADRLWTVNCEKPSPLIVMVSDVPVECNRRRHRSYSCGERVQQSHHTVYNSGGGNH